MDPQSVVQGHAQVEAFSRRHRTGLVTLLFTDIVGSTQLKQALGDQGGVALIQRHHALVREILRAFPEAEEISTAGDSFFIVFAKPSEAVRFALRLQVRLRFFNENGTRDTRPGVGRGELTTPRLAETSAPRLQPLRLQDRIGIHVGEVVIEEQTGGAKPKDLYGIQVDTCARVMSLAEANQILMTRFAFDSARQVLKGQELEELNELQWFNHGPYLLKGVEEPLEICEVRVGGTGPVTPPPSTEKAKRYAVPLEVRLEIVAQAADGLAAAHAAGIIHRDIKPGNILVSGEAALECGSALPLSAPQAKPDANTPGQPGTIQSGRALPHSKIQAKLTDFGIGQVVSQEYLAGVTATGLTQTLVASTSSPRTGTQMYMAPELLSGRPATVQSDIYALGVVLYRLLAADFTRALTIEWAEQVRDDLLQDDVRRCLAGKPEDRFANATDLARNLRSLSERRTARAVAQKEAFERGAARVASLAVLPFVNMSPDPENEFLSDGIAEDLIMALSRVPGLRVPARTSAFAFKGKTQDIRVIGQMLTVETVLEGSVRKAGNRLRITTQLINVADGFHLWSERYDREMQDVFAIQDEITQAIMEALKVRLGGVPAPAPVKRYTPNTDTYQLYLKGRFCVAKYTPEGFALGLRLLEQALNLEPNYPLPYVSVAQAYVMLSHFGHLPPREGMPKSKAAAVRALELDETLGEAHTQLALTRLMYDWDWPGAEQEFRRALELDPGNSEAHHWGRRINALAAAGSP